MWSTIIYACPGRADAYASQSKDQAVFCIDGLAVGQATLTARNNCYFPSNNFLIINPSTTDIKNKTTKIIANIILICSNGLLSHIIKTTKIPSKLKI